MEKSFIVSVAPASSGLFRQELRRDPQARLVESLDAWRHLCAFPEESSYLFALHRFPTQLTASPRDLEFDTVAEVLADWLSEQSLGEEPYGVQLSANLRMEWSFSRLVEELIARVGLAEERFSPREPEVVISVYLQQKDQGGRIFAGISEVEENLSPWSSGQCRIPRDPDSVSRAEAKLIEGWEAFGLGQPQPGLALDLGAAPGGWSRVLADWGFEVHAVDPAPLDPRVASRVHAHQETAGRFLSRPGPEFDLLVCDMKMEAGKVADLLVSFSPRLKVAARIFTTLKLGKGEGGIDEARRALDTLKSRFRVEAARQLFFNRSEVSVLLANPS